MKNFKLLLIAGMLLIGTNVFASNNPEKNAKLMADTSTELASLLGNPSFTLEYTETAVVTFLINSDREVVVLNVDTNNIVVENFIKSKMNYKKLTNQLIQGKRYKLPVRIMASS